ncbi:serine/threonine-protein kinase [Actinocorallia sp. API 0066]|uniref:WD40 repeat domain-containing serine/threonine protein kinase n=1 Tax=Actinocorallia sp. API 0066 TaxID=2896846 RepID=UPI001E3F2BFB|nr:serine/threonine-protein kinase [Actinocorallia sp. API 0066]MCD0453324.1 serine/threonine-protein kinase [Actinocorallia sp. API 0066]
MKAGDVINSRYRLVKRLGLGGYGQVWEATTGNGAEPIAIKIFYREQYSLTAYHFFQEEAMIGSRIGHPGIVKVWAPGHDPAHGCDYFVMELVPGGDLGREILANPEGLPIGRVIVLGERIADILAAMHAEGVVHRDLKPGNILLAAPDQPKICDFGVAHVPNRSPGPTLTMVGVGSYLYMAPERFDERDEFEKTRISKPHQSIDLYALGCVLFELATGEKAIVPPARANYLPSKEDYRKAHREQKPKRLRSIKEEIPLWFDELVNALLEKDPAARPVSAADVAERLRAGVAPPRVRFRRVRRLRPSRRVLVRLGGGAVAVTVAVAVGFALVRANTLATEAELPELARTLAGEVDSLLAAEPEVAARVAVTAWRVSPVAEARAALVAVHDTPWQGGLRGDEEGVHGPVFSRDGALLASRRENTVVLWDMTTRRRLPGALVGHTERVDDVVFSPDGRLVATLGGDGTVRVWHTATRAQSGAPLTFVSFAAARGWDGRKGGIGFVDDTTLAGVGPTRVTFWNVGNRAETATLPLPAGTSHAALSPDGATLAALVGVSTQSLGNTNMQVGKRIEVWDTRTRARLPSPAPPPGVALSAGFTADGGHLVGVDARQRVALWDLTKRRLVTTAATIRTDLLVGPGGRAVVTSRNQRTRVLDPATGEPPPELPAFDGPASGMAFSPDGTLLLVPGYLPGPPALWRLASGHGAPSDTALVAVACGLGNGAMTSADWLRFAPDADPATGESACP